MSESVLMTVYSKAGILIDELILLYSCVLSPVLLQELLDFLIALGCCEVEGQTFPTIKLKSPFETGLYLDSFIHTPRF